MNVQEEEMMGTRKSTVELKRSLMMQMEDVVLRSEVGMVKSFEGGSGAT